MPSRITTIPLSRILPSPQHSRSGFDVWRSHVPQKVGLTALTQDGARLQWQPVYGLTRAGQYAVDEAGAVYVTTESGKQPGTEMILYAFEP